MIIKSGQPPKVVMYSNLAVKKIRNFPLEHLENLKIYNKDPNSYLIFFEIQIEANKNHSLSLKKIFSISI